MATATSADTTRRDFLYIASGAVGAVGAGLAAWPLVDQMNPSAAVLALVLGVNVPALQARLHAVALPLRIWGVVVAAALVLPSWWEVWKWLDTGEVQFRVHSYSRMVGAKNPFTVAGVRLFGQRERRRYLMSACRRMRELTEQGLRGEHPAGAEARTEPAVAH